ncbi:VOC family protein [Streptomyces sp. NPDC058256]|uniref:VOC family protein n=1 Tax=Streptomyces sp. NPDC058256 TaxID=3346408 RepID=UPI0036E13F64
MTTHDSPRHPAASPSEAPGAQLRQVVHPVDDVSAAVEFYGVVLGLPTRFVDGDRYAAFDAGPSTLAVAADAEDVAGVVAAAFKVDDIEAFLDRLAAVGGQVVQGPVDGPHERRVVISDPWGNRLIVYAAL